MTTEKLVEYRTVQHSSLSEASVYMTTDLAHVNLEFENPLICSMQTGCKIMRINGSEAFDFLPGESLLINSSMKLDILFPEASPERPVECVVIEFDYAELDSIVARINETMEAKGYHQRMELDWNNFAHLRNAPAVQKQINRAISYYKDEVGPLRDVLIEAAHSELVLRLLQAQATELLFTNRNNVADTGVNAVSEAIRSKPEARYSTESLAQIAKMSEASLFRHFKARYGITPAKFARTYRIRRAREMLIDQSITSVAYALGFADVAHFSRVFRQSTGETPGKVKRQNRMDS